MATNKTISLLLGSGFSKPAGLADASEINKLFQNLSCYNFISKIELGIVHFKEQQNNEEVDYSDNMGHKYLLCLLINKHLAQSGQFDYEEFYDFFNTYTGYSNKEKAIELLKENYCLFKRYYGQETTNIYLSEDFENKYITYLKEIDKIFNLLLYDILKLNPDKVDVTKFNKYSTFITTLKKLSKIHPVNIFSLNHDLLLENSFERKQVEFCDGFTKDKAFSGSFDKNLNLYKLHGSLSWFEYKNTSLEDNRYKDGDIIKSTIKEQFRNTNNSNWVPKFLTGKKKEENKGVFKILRDNFIENIGKSNEIIIIGYSYRDEYINMILQSEIENLKTVKRIININPNKEFIYDFKNTVVFNYREYDWLKKFQLITNCK